MGIGPPEMSPSTERPVPRAVMTCSMKRALRASVCHMNVSKDPSETT